MANQADTGQLAILGDELPTWGWNWAGNQRLLPDLCVLLRLWGDLGPGITVHPPIPPLPAAPTPKA